MFKSKIHLLFVLTIFLLSACGPSETTSPNETTTPNNTSTENEAINVVFGTPHPTTHLAQKNVYEPWIELVQEKTNGRVTVEQHPNGSLGKTGTAYEDIGAGVYDVGIVTATYLADTAYYPYTIGTLPFAFPDLETGFAVMNKFFEKYYNKDAFQNVVSMGGLTSTDPNIIFSTKPIRSLEDLKGMKIHVHAEIVAEVVKEWGAIPVTTGATTETYQLLERGGLDGIIYTPAGGYSYKLHEVAPYIVDIPINLVPFSLVMNQAFYDSLPDDVAEVFDNELFDFMPIAFKDAYIEEKNKVFKIYEEEIKGKGEIIKLSPEEQEKFIASAQGAWEKWVEEANNRGFDGDKMMADFIGFLKEEGVNVPFEM